MKKIELTRGYSTIVDDIDYPSCVAFKWFTQKTLRRGKVYAARKIRREDGTFAEQYLHQFIMETGPGERVDHEDGDGLNNRRLNIRLCTNQQNAFNQEKQVGCASQFKGVAYYKNIKRWGARIKINGKQQHIGLFNTEIDAALAYDKKAKELFGEFAKPNFQETLP